MNDLVYENGACRVTFFAVSGYRSSRFEGEAIGMERKAYWDNAREWRDARLGRTLTENDIMRQSLTALAEKPAPFPVSRFRGR